MGFRKKDCCRIRIVVKYELGSGMLATRDEALRQFGEYVSLANGRTELVYAAFKQNGGKPTDLEIRNFIIKRVKENSNAAA
jgi:hypothetical protein